MDIKTHYDLLIEENNDLFRLPASRQRMRRMQRSLRKGVSRRWESLSDLCLLRR